MPVSHRGDFDVLVVGAGPAGTSCATILARRGVHVLLCDKAKFPREKICGDCINPKCWDYFDLLGVSEKIAAHAESIDSIKVISRSGRGLSIPLRGLRRRDSASRPFCAIKRSVLDAFLVQQAISEGVTFFESTSLESLQPLGENHNVLQAVLRKHIGHEESFVHTGIIVGADGRNSRVASFLTGSDGVRSGKGRDEKERIGIQFLIGRSGLGSAVSMFFFNGGYGGIVPVTADEANVALVVTRELARLAQSDFQNFAGETFHSVNDIRTSVPSVKLLGEIRTAFPITPRRNFINHGSAFLIGDARRTAEPFTGEGIFYAMQDGFWGARKILNEMGISEQKNSVKPRSRFWVDAVFSPILQKGRGIETLISFGSRHNGLAEMLAGRVIKN